jgi:hypothetical protein
VHVRSRSSVFVVAVCASEAVSVFDAVRRLRITVCTDDRHRASKWREEVELPMFTFVTSLQSGAVQCEVSGQLRLRCVVQRCCLLWSDVMACVTASVASRFCVFAMLPRCCCVVMMSLSVCPHQHDVMRHAWVSLLAAQFLDIAAKTASCCRAVLRRQCPNSMFKWHAWCTTTARSRRESS